VWVDWVRDTAEGSATTGRFAVHRDLTAGALTVSFAVTGTATMDVDYTGLESGSVAFAAGEDTEYLDVTPINDPLVEGTETVHVTLTAPTGAAYYVRPLGSGGATVDILDNDDGTVTVTDAADAHEQGTVPGRFDVHRNTTEGTLEVGYGLSGTATPGVDYTAPPTTGTITLPDGAADAYLDVVPVDDSIVEPTETVVLTLTGEISHLGYNVPSSGGGDPSGTAKIIDNDANVWVDRVRDTAEGSTTTGQFAVHRDETDVPLTVSFAVTGTATPGVDYTGLEAGTVTFAAGEDTAYLDVTPIDDLLIEGTETVHVTLTAPAGSEYQIRPEGSGGATINIYDNDKLIEGTGGTVTGTEGQLLTGLDVATFSELGATGGETYAATIDWGTGPRPRPGRSRHSGAASSG
jgi:hypothetical protein